MFSSPAADGCPSPATLIFRLRRRRRLLLLWPIPGPGWPPSLPSPESEDSKSELPKSSPLYSSAALYDGASTAFCSDMVLCFPLAIGCLKSFERTPVLVLQPNLGSDRTVTETGQSSSLSSVDSKMICLTVPANVVSQRNAPFDHFWPACRTRQTASSCSTTLHSKSILGTRTFY